MTTGRADLVDDDHHGSIVRWWPTPDADPVSIHPVWLLESCVCERCRYPATGRRRREALLVSTDRSPSRVWFDGAHLRAEWADGHLTVTVPPSGPIDGGGSAPPGSPPESVSGRSLATVAWGAGDMVEQESAEQESAERESAEQESAEQESVEQQSIDETVGTTASATVGEIVAALLSDGAVVVTGVPTNEAALLALARRFGPIRPSGYGDVWEIDTTAETGSAAPDAVTSLDGLSPHTDLPYRQLPPGVQFLLSCVAEGVGGASTLVDGRRVVAQLDADDLRTLMEVPVRYGFGPV